MALAIEILALVVGAIVMLLVLPKARRRPRAATPTDPPLRPRDLERLETLVAAGRSSAADLHLHLRPLLAEIVGARLSRRGAGLSQDPAHARSLLGEELWELVRPSRPAPSDSRTPGVTLEQLAQIIERLERLG